MSKGFASNYRVGLLAGFVLAGYGALGLRLAWLHVVDRDHLLASVEMVRREVIPEFARRGDIQDINGALLATSVSCVVVWADPRFVRPEDSSKWPELARLLQVPLAQVQKTLTTRYKTAAQARAGAPESLVLNLNIRIPGEAPPPAAEAAVDAAAPDGGDEMLDAVFETLVRVVHQHIGLSDGSEDVMAALERRHWQWGPHRIPQRSDR